MSERVGSGKQGIDVSKKKQGIVKLDDSHTRKREGSGVKELLCGTFHTKPEAGVLPLYGAPTFHWHLTFVFVFI